jgi:hypothetical protein
LRQRRQLSRSEAPSINKCSLTRLRGESPPPSPGLCRLGPASDALSPLVMLSHGGARPSTVVTSYSPVIARTAHRLLTSAIETNCDHNRTIARSPHDTAGVASSAALLAGGDGPFQSRSQPRFHGSGAARGTTLGLSRSRSLAARASPQPDPLGHLLSRACFRRKLEQPPPKVYLHEGDTPTSSPSWAPLSRNPALKGRFTYSPAKESAIRRTRGAFHRQAHPRKDAPSLPTPPSPARGKTEGRRLFFHCAFFCPDKAERPQ